MATDDNKVLRSYQITIKKGHSFFNYFDDMCFNSKSLYNTTNFFIRQVFTGIKKDPASRHTNEADVIYTINLQMKKLNIIKANYYAKRYFKEKKDNSGKEVKKPTYFKPLSTENPFLSYELLEGVFKVTKQVDYLVLPSHSNQHTMKKAFADWKSYFNSLKEYKKHPEKFNGKPKLPSYANKNGRKIVFFSNQTCVIKENKYLKFPDCSKQLNIGKLGYTNGKLKEVRVTPNLDTYLLEVVFELSEQDKPLISNEPHNIIGIDLGVDNFAAITNNMGLQPVLIKGKVIKAINQYYNKQYAHYYSILRMGKSQKEGKFTSKRLNEITRKRNNQIKNYMHKVSKYVVDYCLKNNIDTIVIGKNVGNKQNINIGNKNNQKFVQIPHSLFISFLEYKSKREGIRIILNEESYTSKSSFIDGDSIPIYDENKAIKHSFSGKRVKRGLYKSKGGILINADCNGSGNIIRKVIPNAFSRGDSGVVNKPIVVNYVSDAVMC